MTKKACKMCLIVRVYSFSKNKEEKESRLESTNVKFSLKSVCVCKCTVPFDTLFFECLTQELKLSHE